MGGLWHCYTHITKQIHSWQPHWLSPRWAPAVAFLQPCQAWADEGDDPCHPQTDTRAVDVILGFMWLNNVESWLSMAIYWAHCKTWRSWRSNCNTSRGIDCQHGSQIKASCNGNGPNNSQKTIGQTPTHDAGKQGNLGVLKLQRSWHVMAMIAALISEPHRLPMHCESHTIYEKSGLQQWTRPLQHDHHQLLGCFDHAHFPHQVPGITRVTTPSNRAKASSQRLEVANALITFSAGPRTPQGLVVSTCINPFSKYVPSFGWVIQSCRAQKVVFSSCVQSVTAIVES